MPDLREKRPIHAGELCESFWLHIYSSHPAALEKRLLPAWWTSCHATVFTARQVYYMHSIYLITSTPLGIMNTQRRVCRWGLAVRFSPVFPFVWRSLQSCVERWCASWLVLNPSSQELTVMSWVCVHIPAQQSFDHRGVGWTSLLSASDLIITFPTVV